MYVCVCNALNDRDIKDAACRGACRAAEVHRQLGVRPQCGRCMSTIRQMLVVDAETQATRPQAAV